MNIVPTGMSVVSPTTIGSTSVELPSVSVGGSSPAAIGHASLQRAAIPSYGVPLVPTSAAAVASAGAASLGAAGSSAITVTDRPVWSTDAAPQRLTSVAPGGRASDADLVEATLDVLRRSPAGSQLVDRLLAVGARVNVISDAEFAAMGNGDAHAFYDPTVNAMYLRRSDLAEAHSVRFAAVALAHEGTHLLDDAGALAEPFVRHASARIDAAGGPRSAAGAALQRHAAFELTMIKETRAFTFAGQVARDLGVQTPPLDPTSIAAAGGNDQATYDRVWNALLHSTYNPRGLVAAPRNF